MSLQAIVLVSTVAVVQEYKSDQTLAALSSLAPPRCTVRRQGRVAQLVAHELVPGDIVLLNVGDRVPADLRLLHAHHLQVDESSLTGEAEPVRKQTAPLDSSLGAEESLAERSNVAFMGTLVRHACTFGNGSATGAREHSLLVCYGSSFVL